MADTGLEPAFIAGQRQRLLKLRAGLLAAAGSNEREESELFANGRDGSPEAEEDAQRLNLIEVDQNRVDRDLKRIDQIDRALRKIEEGTYGLSDQSGEPILRERLQAVPEAILTLEEEELHERPGSVASAPRRP